MTNAVARIARSCGSPSSSSTSSAKTIDAAPRGPNQPRKADRRPPRARSQHRDRNRDHADEREAEDRVERDLPVEVADRRPEEHRAEEDERHGGKDGAGLLYEVGHLAAAVPAHTAESSATDERGDEARSPDRLREAEREERAGERNDLEPGVVDVPTPLPWTTTAAATAPARTPIRIPYPIFSATSWTACPCPIAPSSASATASAIRKSGTQIPSLRPVSTFRLWRIRTGRRWT